ncbi:hypothetical protein [Halovenus amylolytica]
MISGSGVSGTASRWEAVSIWPIIALSIALLVVYEVRSGSLATVGSRRSP